MKIMMLSFLGAVGCQGMMVINENIRYSNSMFSFLIFLGFLFINHCVYADFEQECKRNKVFATCFSLLLSVALHFGARMERVENVRLTDIGLWLEIVCMTIAFPPIINAIWNYLNKISEKIVSDETGIEDAHKRYFDFYQIWIIIFLMWLPSFLALYPGAFVYDAQDEYIEVISRAFTTHHPLLHVLALGGTIHAAEYIGWTANTGIAIYVVVQMVIISLILAYSIRLLQKWGVNRKYLIGTLVFYGLFPIFPLYAVCTAKDGLFTAFFFLIVLFLNDFIFYETNEKGKGQFFTMRKMLLFVFASVLMMLFRNNGMYAYIVAVPFMLLAGKTFTKDSAATAEKGIRQFKSIYKLILLMLLSVMIYKGADYILKTVTNAEDSEHQEMLTVPIQQIARTYTYSRDVFTDEDIDTLYEVLPEEYLITYRPRVSDVLKSGFDNRVYESNPSKYRKLWLKIGFKKPLIYLNAWFGTSYGYWYPDAINNVYGGNQMYTFQYADSSYFGFETEPPGERDSKFPIFERFYRKLSLELFQQKLPVVSMLFSPGFVFWLFALILLGKIRDTKIIFIEENTEKDKTISTYLKNDYRFVIPYIPVVMLWLTVLLGPTTLVRYVLILWYIIPLYLVIDGQKRKRQN